MSFVLEAVRDKPVGLWLCDGTSPFTDYSSYARSATVPTVANGLGLVNGATKSLLVHKTNVMTTNSPVFIQGSESQPFSLEAWFRPVYKTTGQVAPTYRENLILNPSAAVDVFSGWQTISTDSGGITRIADTSVFPQTAARKTSTTTGSIGLGAMTATVPVGTYSASYWVRCSVSTALTIYLEGTATKSPVSKVGAALTANTWAKQTITFNVTVAGTVKVGGYVTSPVAVGSTLDMTAVILETGSTSGAYFDGNMAGYEWAGTANGSISRVKTTVSRVNLAAHSGSNGTVTSPVLANLDTTNSTLAKNSVVWNSQTWHRYTWNGTGNNILRQYLNINNLVAGEPYTVTAQIGNDSASAISISVDWCDEYITTVTIQPGTSRTVTTGGIRSGSGYNSTYRFSDFQINAAGNFLIKDILVEQGTVSRTFFDGASPGAEWKGTANASESFLTVSDTEQQVLGNTGQADGITMDGTKISFVTKYLTTGECRATYDIQIPRAVAAVGVHQPDRNQLYVDGKLVAETPVTEAQRADKYVATNGSLYSGYTTSSKQLEINAVGIYAQSLSAESVTRHFEMGRMPNNHILDLNKGLDINLDKTTASLIFNHTWTKEEDWRAASLERTVVENAILKPQLQSGFSVPGTWRDSIDLYDAANPNTIQEVSLNWDGEGAVVKVSVDGSTWETVTRNQAVATIPAGFNPTGKELYIEISFPGNIANDPAFVRSMSATGIKNNVATINAGITATYTEPVTIMNAHNPIELAEDWGSRLNGGYVVVSGDTTSNPVVPRTIEIWLKRNDSGSFYIDGRTTSGDVTNFVINIGQGGPGNGFTRVTTYMNGQTWAAGTAVPTGEWVVLHLVPTNPLTSQLYVNVAQWGYNAGQSTSDITVGKIVYYETALTASQIAEIVASYSGKVSARSVDGSTLGVAEPASSVNIYAHDWSISPAG